MGAKEQIEINGAVMGAKEQIEINGAVLQGDAGDEAECHGPHVGDSSGSEGE
jgi:hypothetical protein